jgi:two-component system, cell cycle response regulator
MAAVDDDDGLDDATVVGADPPVVGALKKDRAYLIVLAGAQVGEMISLKGRTVIGRGAEADVRLVEDKMSRRHFCIFDEDGASYVEDLGSTNGTYVNGERITRHQLNDGDKIQIGDTTILKFTYNDTLEENFQKQLYDSALRDGLTKIFNKKYFLDRIATEFAFTKRHAKPLSLILFDIDHFKTVNDTLGHQAGDMVLSTLGHHVQSLVRAEDVFARYGGEEFAILCRETEVENAVKLAERIRIATEQLAIEYKSDSVSITISVGVAMIPDDQLTDVDLFVAAADEVLYAAKHRGRNRVVARPRPGAR